MKQIVLNYILENNLINYGDTVICGLSGGADSCAMLKILHSLKDELSITLLSAHLNHKLRGEESKRDMEFAKEFSNHLGIKFFSEETDVALLSKTMGISLEDAGRKARYDFFDRIMKETKATKIATAHNKNDNTETVLMHIIRGCGISGLCGIPPKRGNIIRPMLCLSRKEIEAFCEKEKINYITDSSNLSPAFTRNKLRLEIIPKIKEINPSFDDAVERLTLCAHQNSKITNECISEISFENINGEVITSPITNINSNLYPLIIQKATNEFMPGLEISSKNQVALCKMLKLGKNNIMDIGAGVCASVSYGRLKIYKKESLAPFSVSLTSKPVKLMGKEIYISNTPEFFSIPWDGEKKVVIRNKKPGDKMKIRGFTRKLQDMYVNLKIDRSLRDKLLIITYNGSPIWAEKVGVDDSLKNIIPKKYIVIKSEDESL